MIRRQIEDDEQQTADQRAKHHDFVAVHGDPAGDNAVAAEQQQRVSYRIVTKPLDVEAYRTIGIAMKNRQELSLAAKRFLEYMDDRYQSE